jgi:ribosomal protein L2
MATSPKKPEKHILINPTTAGVIYDEVGHSIGGGERVEVEEIDLVGKSAIKTGLLIEDKGTP